MNYTYFFLSSIFKCPTSSFCLSVNHQHKTMLLSHFSRVRLCDPRDGSPPGSPVPGILQARTLEWVAIAFSNAWNWKVKVKPLSRVRLLGTPWIAAYQAPPSMGFSRQKYWSGLPLPSRFPQFSEAFWPTTLLSGINIWIDQCVENDSDSSKQKIYGMVFG